LVDVLALAAKRAGHWQAEQIDPQVAQRGFARPADRDLLYAEDAKRTRHRFAFRTSASVRRPGRGALTRIAMLPDGGWLSRISWWHSPVWANAKIRDRHGSTLPSSTRRLTPCACWSLAK